MAVDLAELEIEIATQQKKLEAYLTTLRHEHAQALEAEQEHKAMLTMIPTHSTDIPLKPLKKSDEIAKKITRATQWGTENSRETLMLFNQLKAQQNARQAEAGPVPTVEPIEAQEDSPSQRPYTP